MYELKEKERIFVFTGPDGSGRKTVADMVGNTLGLRKVVSYTTRPRRSSEVDGQDYHFITVEEFKRAEANNEFIEVDEVNGHYYGIKGHDIEKMFKHNDFIYVVLNAQGARILKKLFGEKVIRIFIYVDRDVIIERQKLIERARKYWTLTSAIMIKTWLIKTNAGMHSKTPILPIRCSPCRKCWKNIWIAIWKKKIDGFERKIQTKSRLCEEKSLSSRLFFFDGLKF